jgi:radical SAM superfamily enzyme YgiQ (UPF0313 family)
MTTDRIDVGLLASTIGGSESLALGYLAAALADAGHRPHVVTFDGWREIDDAARRLAELDAPLVGVALPSAPMAIDALAAAYRLLELGYRGHLTCGGAWATLARERILATHPIVDSVVRYDGELPLARLADAVAAGRDPRDVPGLTTRSGDGRPAPLGATPFVGMRPLHDRFRRFAGIRTAKLSAVRGCFGGCTYCGLAAVRREMRAEAQAAGWSRAELRRCGVGGMRRRPVTDVADEMAGLYHEHDVRFFHFVDENHLPRRPDDALFQIRALDRELERRRVGRRAISMMLRADVATPAVLEALADLGVTRSLLGVESLDRAGLAALGRGTAPEANAAALRGLVRRGIRFHYNLLLVHPYSTIASIGREVAALKQVHGGLVDPIATEVYEGTDLFRRLQAEGRLRGGPILWFYEPADEQAARFARIFRALGNQAQTVLPLTSFAYDVQGMLAVSEQLGRIGPERHRLGEALDRITERHNALWVETLEQALAIARRGDEDAIAPLVERTGRHAARLILELEAVRRRLEEACVERPVCDIVFPRTAAAVALAVALLGGGCHRAAEAPSGDDDEGEVDDTDTGDTEVGDSDSETGDTDTDTECTPQQYNEEYVEIWYAGHDAGCDDPCTPLTTEDYYRFVVDEDGYVTGIEVEDGGDFPAELAECYVQAVEGQVFPCLAGQEYWVSCEPIALE